MKATAPTLISLALMAGMIAACAPASSKVIAVDEQDSGSIVELRAGDTLVVSLEGNITTGFTWVPAPQIPPLLEQVGEVMVTPAGSQVGSPGTIVLRFKAAAAGQADLHLDYKRPWEANVAPEKTFDLTVVVR